MRRLALLAAVALAAGLFAPWPAGASNDPFRVDQWGLDQIRAEQAWATSDGDGVVVAVVDSGVDLDHPDLAGQLIAGTTTLCEGQGVVTCGDGSWRSGARGGQTDCIDGASPCDSPHGTHVAGIIAAAANNGIGVAGVAPGAKIMPVKAIDEDGGNDEQVSNGIRWAADHGADVINLSLGKIPGAQALDFIFPEVAEAVTYATGKGILVVAAAGNDTAPLCGTPSWTEGALCVTSTDPFEAPSYFSNAGIKPDLLSVAAPGGHGTFCDAFLEILSTVPTDLGTAPCAVDTVGYDTMAGTSMATPHVAGVAALLAGEGHARDEILETLIATSRTPGSLARGVWTPQYGYGIVDAEAAVAFSTPTEPTTTTTTSTTTAPTTTTTVKKGKGGGKPDR